MNEIEFDSTFEITKKDDDQQFVFGWANVAVRKSGEQIIDYQEDIVDVEDLELAAYDFNLNYRETGEMHEGDSKGALIESFIVTPEKLAVMKLAPDALPLAWWVGFHIPDKDVYMKVKNGQYKMFSIQGKAKREEVS